MPRRLQIGTRPILRWLRPRWKQVTVAVGVFLSARTAVNTNSRGGRDHENANDVIGSQGLQQNYQADAGDEAVRFRPRSQSFRRCLSTVGVEKKWATCEFDR
jgi:hypothetical protein